MNLPVVFRREAQGEFDETADWYEAKQAGQGVAFVAAIQQVLASVASRPKAHPIVQADIREVLVSRYPYAVYYRPE